MKLYKCKDCGHEFKSRKKNIKIRRCSECFSTHLVEIDEKKESTLESNSKSKRSLRDEELKFSGIGFQNLHKVLLACEIKEKHVMNIKTLFEENPNYQDPKGFIKLLKIFKVPERTIGVIIETVFPEYKADIEEKEKEKEEEKDMLFPPIRCPCSPECASIFIRVGKNPYTNAEDSYCVEKQQWCPFHKLAEKTAQSNIPQIIILPPGMQLAQY